MRQIINICGKPSCCPQILIEDGQYKIFDEEKDWETGFMSKDDMFHLKKTLNKII